MHTLGSLFTPRWHARLDGFAGFYVTGADCNSFLQGQLTNDVTGLPLGLHQRTGYCTPKGRLIATLLQWRMDDQTIGHVLPQSLLEPTVKRLQMFVLRAKARFSLPQEGFQVFGIWGSPTEQGQQWIADTNGAGVMALSEHSRAWCLVEPACPVLGPRAWIVADAQSSLQIAQQLSATAALSQSAWEFSEIQSARPWVVPATREAFVPQMINFELVNGVSFTKGCYPGQEVVARSQYLGKLKRRMFRADVTDAQALVELLAARASSLDCAMHSETHSDTDSEMGATLAHQISALAGADVWSPANPSEPCGQVVNAAVRFDAQGQQVAGATFLIESSQDAWDQGGCRLMRSDGPVLTPIALPYAIPAAA